MSNTAKDLNYETKKRRILVVDDDEFSLTLVNSALKSEYELVLIKQASLALEAAQEHYPDLMLLDLNMPNVDGYEILNQFKSHPFLSTIPIVCLSGEKSIEARSQARELGASGFMSKPINKSKLKTDIESILSSSNMSINSRDNQCRIFIGYNIYEKEAALHQQIKEWDLEGSSTIMISLSSGQNFCNDYELSLIEKEKLFYFQIKGHVMSKLPFMQDLNPIIHDLESLIKQPTKEFNLIFDDPNIVLNQNKDQQAVGQIIMFSELIKKSFNKIAYFERKATSTQSQEAMNNLANILIGQY